uniref:FXYD domain-containing ion transport regulator n=1 Tax=Rhinolophus ferrumequinum TaxID=59479 RepID=A0A671EGN5_RHIFE
MDWYCQSRSIKQLSAVPPAARTPEFPPSCQKGGKGGGVGERSTRGSSLTSQYFSGQTLVTTPVPGADSTPVNFPALTPPVHPEFQPTPQTPSLPADVETSPAQTENQTQQQPTRMDVPLTTDPGADKSSTEAPPTKGTTPSKQSPGNDFTADPALRPTGSSEDNPFFYGKFPWRMPGGGRVKLFSPFSSASLSADVATLRKRGLLVAAVLFITGIVILTSGKCRQWSKLCRNHNRTYRVVTKA